MMLLGTWGDTSTSLGDKWVGPNIPPGLWEPVPRRGPYP